MARDKLAEKPIECPEKKAEYPSGKELQRNFEGLKNQCQTNASCLCFCLPRCVSLPEATPY
jgi:hypothetical protein